KRSTPAGRCTGCAWCRSPGPGRSSGPWPGSVPLSLTVGFFGAVRQGRKDDLELGKGLWRRAHDRFHRGLDRYHQVLEGVDDDQLYNELVEIANELAELSPRSEEQTSESQSQ